MSAAGNVRCAAAMRATPPGGGHRLLKPVARVRLGTLVGLLVGWEALALSGLVDAEFVPHLGTLAGAFGDVLTVNFADDVRVTLTELLWGVVIGGGLGLALGLPLGMHPTTRRLVEPLLVYLGAVPKIVLYPVFLLFLSVGTESKIGMAALSAFFPVVLQTLEAAVQVRPVWINAARMLQTTALQRARHVWAPAMAPSIYAGLRLGVASGIIGTLMAETKAAQSGVGFRVIYYYGQYQIPQMYVVLLLVFLFSIAVAVAMSWIGRRLRLSGDENLEQELRL